MILNSNTTKVDFFVAVPLVHLSMFDVRVCFVPIPVRQTYNLLLARHACSY